NISDLQAGFRRRRVRLDARHVNAGRLARLSRKTPKLRIARREKTKAGRGKAAVVLALRVFQKVRDDGGGDRIEDLRARIETQKQTGQLIVFNEGNRVAVLAILHRNAYAVGKKLSEIGRISRHLDRRDEAFRHDKSAGRFQLPGGETIAHHRIESQLKRNEAIEKFRFGWLEQRKVRLVIDDDNVRRRLFAR